MNDGKRLGQIFACSLIAVFAALLIGGCASYPIDFGKLHGGQVSREHAKPMEGGYYQNFDKKAATIEVGPVESTNPVNTQHVLVATVKDAAGNPLPGRRVEWMLAEGSVGAIVEVDESGWYNTRGHKVTNKYAISHSNQGDHVLTRGNSDPSDDIVLGKGQTWCTITSPTEGDSHVIAYAPAIYNWDKHKVFAIKHWRDVKWEWPKDAVNPIGTDHEFVVKVAKASDGTPLDCIVDFSIVSGPDAVFRPSNKKTASVKTAANGTASVTLAQVKPAEGQNVIEMIITREQCGECNPPVKIASGKVKKTWVGPRIGIKKTAPEQAGLGDEFDYQIVVNNPGKATATNVKVADTLPAGIEFVTSQPTAKRSGQNLEWSLGSLKQGANKAIRVKVKATKTGTFENCAVVTADHKLSAKSCDQTVVTAPRLAIKKTGPAEVLLCDPIKYTVVVTNSGDGPTSGVVVKDNLPNGLLTEAGNRAVNINVGTLNPGQSKKATYSAKASKPGTYTNTAIATDASGLKAEATHKVVVRQPVLVVTKTGPKIRYIGRAAAYEITVTNKGDGAARDTVLTDTVPGQMQFVSASDGGQLANGRVTWNLGTLAPNASRKVTVNLRASQIGTARNTANAQAYCAKASASAVTEVSGLAAILLEVVDVEDPIEVGANETYLIIVTNQGSAVGTNIKIDCTLPNEQQYVSITGPTNASVNGKNVSVAPLGQLAPKAKATYKLVVKATATGDLRFKVELKSDQMTSPVMETESTHVY